MLFWVYILMPYEPYAGVGTLAGLSGLEWGPAIQTRRPYSSTRGAVTSVALAR